MSTPPLIDQAMVEETRKIVGDRLSLVLECYLKAAPKYIAEIKAGLEAEDYDMVASGAHSLKSSSRQVGATLVSSLARELELLCKSDKLQPHLLKDKTEEIHTTIQYTYTKTSNVIQNIK